MFVTHHGEVGKILHVFFRTCMEKFCDYPHVKLDRKKNLVFLVPKGRDPNLNPTLQT